MKSLNIVQKIAGILYNLALAGKTVCGIGTVAALIGGAILLGSAYLPADLVSMVMNFAHMDNSHEGGIMLLCWCILCTACGIVFGYGQRYLKHELADGTPFTHEGAKELLYLGIRIMAWPLGATIVTAIICGYANVNMEFANLIDAGLGWALILLSFVFHYGADLENRSKKNQPHA